MPEGPEVLTISDQLDFYLTNKTLTSIDFLSGKYEENYPDNFEEFRNDLPMKIKKVFCKGKLIIFELINSKKSWYILNSLRMTGCWRFDNHESHGRACMNFSKDKDFGVFDITKLYYIDTRSFGTFDFVTSIDESLETLADGFIGVDEIDYDTFYKNVKSCKKASFTTKLTDQKSICSGIGNYLLSEIMYESSLHPEIKCNELDDKDIKCVFENCSKIIKKSYKLGGMSMRDYVDLYGNEGSFESHLKVYGRKKDPHGNLVSQKKRSTGQTIWYVQELQQKK
jgi:formamidopyrimidine-DNA glycosylase